MNTYLVSYDLNKPGQNYDELFKAIKQFGTWWHHLESTWIIKTDLTSVEIRDRLSRHIDSSDELLVARLSREAAWVGFNQEGSNWLKQNL